MGGIFWLALMFHRLILKKSPLSSLNIRQVRLNNHLRASHWPSIAFSFEIRKILSLKKRRMIKRFSLKKEEQDDES